ncbi:MAG: bifunctional UDP-N-acetylglucosamine diphosphorylase/glucosamine-1-phosphate N-acetyltransferase GlmU [Actinobacteria bacterium]|nr:MAG: bifunctional UDP-N-acetylglucosamine diphosphorylase/glucosamine-1-phosphate N-acetyltransferase GlmU [Actinomycetota bacterium]
MSARRPLWVVLMAAGEGTRMRSERPKPLHVLCGRAMLLHILDALSELPIDRTVVVVGHAAERITKTLLEQGPPGLPIEFVEQHRQRGTGDAAGIAMTALPEDDTFDDGDVMVLPGDTPLARLVQAHRESDAAATLLTARPDDATGYGRVIRGRDDRVVRVVEQGDATPSELAVDEVNTSIYCFRRSVLAPALRRLSPDNNQGEYYLTDVVEVLHDAGYEVSSVVADDPGEITGVNDRVQLAAAEAELRRRTNERWMRQGVTMLDPDRTYVDATVELQADVTLFPGTMLHGRTVVGAGARIGPDVRLVDCMVGRNAVVSHSVGHDAEIGDDAVVGPFAVLEPGCQIAPGARTGPFYNATAGDD